MNVQERRRKPRNPTDGMESMFIEIRHTFGPVRKSIYKVVECNEYGLSFLIPVSDGYFRVGSPLAYCLVRENLQKVECHGIVRYYHAYNDLQGNAYYKVGVESSPLGGTQPDAFRIRPERFKLTELQNEHAIYFSVGEQIFQHRLVDISRYSASFVCSEDAATVLQVSNTVDGVVITFSTRTIFEGTVIITRKEIEGDKYRVVIEPRGAVFNLDVIEQQETLSNISAAVDLLVSSTKKFRGIGEGYKAIVADMRAFLEGYSKILDMPHAAKLSQETEQTGFLEALQDKFGAQFNLYVKELDFIINSMELSEEEHGLYKSYLQRQLHPVLMSAPFCHRMYFKPLGYPGDYEMMRMINDNEYEGPTLFSKLLNKQALENPLAVAARNRHRILAERIGEFVETNPDKELRLLSIACGPALEIQKLIEERPSIADRIHITLLDQDPGALKFSQDNIYMKRILSDSSIQVELIQQSVVTFLKQIARGAIGMQKFDLIYAFGLFDYFDGRTCGFCLNQCSELLNESGKILVSNFSLDGHFYRTYMEYAFEWFIVYRSKEQILRLANMVKKTCKKQVDQDPTGVIKFLELQF